MNIMIAASVNVTGNEEGKMLKNKLVPLLKEKGHIVDDFSLPYSEELDTLSDQIYAMRMIDTSECDALITLGFPACMLEHPNKYVFLFATHPFIVEIGGVNDDNILNEQNDLKIKKAILNSQNSILQNAKEILCDSALLKDNLESKVGLKAKVVENQVLISKTKKKKRANLEQKIDLEYIVNEVIK